VIDHQNLYGHSPILQFQPELILKNSLPQRKDIGRLARPDIHIDLVNSVEAGLVQDRNGTPLALPGRLGSSEGAMLN